MNGYYVAVSALALIAVALWRGAWRKRVESREINAAWLENFSPVSYRPMLRLANSEDPGYLNQRSGPKAAAHYRQMQRRMFREYLRGLSRDFHRLHNIASKRSWRGRIEEKLKFVFSMWDIEARLFLDNFSPCNINPRPLLNSVDELTAKARKVNLLYKPNAGIT